MKFAYQNTGNVSPSWARGYPPAQARAADAKSLGGLGLYEYTSTYALPGAPEMIHGVTETLGNVQGMAGLALGAYHGYKRSGGSLGWAAIWGFAGAMAPLITAGVAIYQGFGERK